MRNAALPLCLALALLPAVGCGKSDGKTQPAPPKAAGSTQAANPYGDPYAKISFLEDPKTNNTPPVNLLDLSFVGPDNSKIGLRDYVGKKNVVLVVTRGFSGSLCLYCSTQTSRLIANYDRFKAKEAEVLVLFPGDPTKLGEFLEKARPENRPKGEKAPFPILLDEKTEAVKALGITHELAKPSTYILDKNGKIRFAYVGATLADRPSIDAMLKQLDAVNRDPGA